MYYFSFLLILASILISTAYGSNTKSHDSPLLRKLSKAKKAYSYSYRVYHNMDRGYSPLTTDMCQTDKDYKKLLSCDLWKKNSNLLDQYSTHYLNKEFNQWRRRSSKDVSRNVDRYFRHVYSMGRIYGKRKRNRRSNVGTSDAKLNNNVNSSKVLSRFKREVPGNPCVLGEEKRTIIYYALDAETEDPMELLQDPKGQKYQTFYTRDCVKQVFDKFHCEISFVTHQAAVFDVYTGYVIHRPVKIATTCIMTVQ